MACGEFSLVARCFDRIRSSHLDVELGIGDGCAPLNIPEKQTLAISTDALVAGNYFLPDVDPANLTYKALAMNLSDLAAMGADPTWLMLVLILPDVDEVWLESFSDSLFDLPNYYDMQLIGGDTTRGPLPMTLGIHGFIPTGRALTRSGAEPSDWACVTSTPGDSTTGLAILQNRLQVADAKGTDYLIKRHPYPPPCILQGQALHDLINSATDLPDDPVSNLGHIARASDYGTRIDLASLPFFDALSHHAEPEQALCWASSGGKGYELCFAVPELNHGMLDAVPGYLGVPFTCIGQMTADIEGLCFIRDGEPVMLDWRGYDHFTTS